MSRFRVALVQTHWRSTPQENLDHVLAVVDAIGRTGDADLVCLPEFFLGPPFYFPGKADLKGQVDETIPGALTETMGRLCREHALYLLGGTIVEKEGAHPDAAIYYNTSFVLGPDGALLGRSRKLHRFSAEMFTVSAGEEQLLLDTPFGKLGICICSDFWIEEMPRLLALQGAEIIYVPGSSLVQNIQTVRPCVFANSVHNVCYTLYTSAVGRVVGRRNDESQFSIEFGGHSCVASPTGILGQLDGEEDVLYVDLDTDEIRRHRKIDVKFKDTLYWCLWGRRPELYRGILEPYVEARTDLAALVGEYLVDEGRLVRDETGALRAGGGEP